MAIVENIVTPPPRSPLPPNRLSGTHLLLLTLILLLAAGLRLYHLSALGYWTDEFITLMNAQGWGVEINRLPLDQIVPARAAPTRLADARPWSQIAAALVRDDSHPPLYIFLVRAWETLWGDEEPAVRSLSVIFSLAAIVLLYLVAEETADPAAALWACLLMAVTGPQISFAQEAGKFALLMMLALLAAWGLLRLRRRETVGAAAVTGAAALAMMLTHYFALGAAAGLGLYALISLRGRARTFAMTAFILAAVLFCALWGPSLLRQRANFTANYSWVSDSSPGHVGRVLQDLARLPARLITEVDPDGWQNVLATIAGGLFLLVLLPTAFIMRPNLRLHVVWFVCAVGLLVCVDLARTTLQLRVTRYTLVAAPAMCVLLSTVVPRGRFRFTLAALVAAVALVRLPAAYLPPWKIDFRTPVEIVASKIHPDDGLVLASADRAMVVVSYTAFQHYAGALMPATVATLTRPADAQVIERLRSCPRVWVMWMAEDQQINQWLPALRIEQAGRISPNEQIVMGTMLRQAKPSTTRSADQR